MPQLTIAPAILTESPDRYKQLVDLYHTFTRRAQIDISDGTLAAAITVPDAAIWWPQGWTIDVHLIVAQPSSHVPTLIKLKPHLVILHPEAQEDLLPIFAALHQHGIKTGVAIQKNVYPGDIKPFIEAADHALIFSGNLGEMGGTADLLLLEKVRIIKKLKPTIEIGWDGGANIRNIRTIAQAGVGVINVGSALSTSQNPAEVYKALVTEADNPGIL